MGYVSEQHTRENPPVRNLLCEAGISYSLSGGITIAVSLLFTIILQLFGATDVANEDWYIYMNFLLPQLCGIGVIAIYHARSKRSLIETGVCVCKWKYFLLAILVEFGLAFSLSYLNNGFIWLLESLGYEATGMALPSLDGWGVLPALLVIALLPALVEETIFRGIITRNMHASGWGTVATVLISGALFSLYHGNPQQTFYQFACGACYALIALRAGSILPTMIAHLLNNAVTIILLAVYSAEHGYNFGYLDIMPTGAFIALSVCSGLCLIATLAYLIFADKSNRQSGGVHMGKIFFLSAGIGLLIFSAEWISVLVMGFFHA